MKNIIKFGLLAVLGAVFFASCEDDNDSNPIYQQPTTFTLNTPAWAVNNVIDTKEAKSLVFTCSQPDYGYTAAVTYALQISLNEDMSDFVQIEKTTDNCRLELNGTEFSEACIALYGEDAELPKEPVAIYARAIARLTAEVDFASAKSAVLSNTIVLPKVFIQQPPAPEVVPCPTTMYLVGSMPASNWGIFIPMGKVCNKDGRFYTICYFPANANFKVCPDPSWSGKERGFADLTLKAEGVDANFSLGNDGNAVIDKAGWYTVYIVTKSVNGLLEYTVTFSPAELYLIGDPTGGQWGFEEDWKFAEPADANGEFVSPAATSDGELRMAIKTSDSWWETEFTFTADGLLYRDDMNIATSWSADGPEGSSQRVSAGQVVKVNFTTNSATIE